MKKEKVLKEALLAYCQSFTQTTWERLQTDISTLKEGLSSETKSSAGDKHETGRAMLQLKREQLGEQLARIEQEQLTLQRISKKANHSSHVQLGSLVITTTGKYFIAISCGEITIDNEPYFAISPATPIGRLLLGKKMGEIYTFRGVSSTIMAVF